MLTYDNIANLWFTTQMTLKSALASTTKGALKFSPFSDDAFLKMEKPEQLERLDCRIMLGNTYHLGNRPGEETLIKAGGLHNFMGWGRALLTDLGGFQMVSLLKLAEITEEGVKFRCGER